MPASQGGAVPQGFKAADALSLQKSHKFQRIVVGHRKYRRDFFKKRRGRFSL